MIANLPVAEEPLHCIFCVLITIQLPRRSYANGIFKQIHTNIYVVPGIETIYHIVNLLHVCC